MPALRAKTTTYEQPAIRGPNLPHQRHADILPVTSTSVMGNAESAARSSRDGLAPCPGFASDLPL